jgi:hypothetical protein
MKFATSLCAALALFCASNANSFTILPIGAISYQRRPLVAPKIRQNDAASHPSDSPTALHLLLDVPDSFFTITFPMLGILLSISKNAARVRMEENAWEQRLAEGRAERLRRDPSLTELDLRRQEAELEWSAYGKPRMQEERANKQVERESKYSNTKRVMVKERRVVDNDNDDSMDRDYRMTDEEIQAFELEYGVDYDPYYDDPYSVDELPEGKYSTDKRYGDRVYENGEVFFCDANSGLYYRQGSKPRGSSFWG